MKTVLFGYGLLGKTVYETLKEKIDEIYDVKLGRNIEEFNEKNCLIINCLPSKMQKKVMDIAAKNNCSYVDFSLGMEFSELLSYKKYFRENFAFCLAGLAPGISNIIASFHLEKYDNVFCYLFENSLENSNAVAWCPEDFSLKDFPVFFEKGQKIVVERLFCVLKKFDEIVEKKEKFYVVYQDEIESLAFFFKDKKPTIGFYAGGKDIEKQKTVKEGFIGKENLNGVYAMFFESYKGSGVVESRAVFPTTKEIEEKGLPGNYITYPCALFLEALFNVVDIEQKKGLLFPEMLSREERKEIINFIHNKLSDLWQGKGVFIDKNLL